MIRIRTLAALSCLVAISALAAPRKSKGPKTGQIAVTSNAPDAAVSIDMLEVGTAPLPPFEVLVGEHALEVTRPGWTPYKAKFVVEAGKTLQINAVLQAVAGVITVKSDEAAAVGIDGTAVGPTPVWWHEVKAGQHKVTVTYSGGRVYEETVNSVLGEEILVDAKAAKARVPAPPLVAKVEPPPPPPKVETKVAPPPPEPAPVEALPPPEISTGAPEWYSRWWVWAAVGAVVAGTAGGVAYATRGTEFVPLAPNPSRDCPTGDCIVLGGIR